MNHLVFMTWSKMSRYRFVQMYSKNGKRKGQISLLVLSFLFTLSTIEAQHEFSSTAGAIDDYFSKLESFGLSGSLLIGNKDEILLKKDYGLNTSANGIDPAYLVGSISKQYTSTAILMLEQRGLLKTSDYLSTHLKNIPQDKSKITIHHLLTHTSGLKDDYWDQHPTLTEEEYIVEMLSKALEAEPGVRFSYANFGYHLLAKIVETVSKKDYERFLVEELFRPNGLENTGFNLVKWKASQVVKYTDWTTAGSEQYLKNPLDRPVYLQPEGSGGILSTTADLYKWYQVIFHSEKILSAASKRKLLTVEKENYGYGWEIYPTSRGTQLIEHGGYDSWVGVVTGIYNFVDEDLVVIFLGNTHMSQFLLKDELMNNIEALIFGGSVRLPPAAWPNNKQIDLNPYLGIYENAGQSISIAKGKKSNQIRLRTTDEKTIQQLLFPRPIDSEKRTDIQLEYVFNHFKNNDYEPLKDTYFKASSFERLKARYSTIWNQLNASMGTYKGIRVLHTLPNIYEGKFELQIFTELQFENGSFYVRAFRDHNGRIHIQHLDFPKKLDIFLIPTKDGEFVYWNVKTGISSKIKIHLNKLIVNSNLSVEFEKK